MRKAFAGAGFADVATYINSGNILFSSPETDTQKLSDLCRKLILDKFGLNLRLALLSAEDLLLSMRQAPTWWNADANSKHNAIYVIAPAIADEVCAQVGPIRPEYEQVEAHGQIIFWSAPLKTFSRTAWSKVSSGPVYADITIRNANTALKLAQLLQTR